MLPFSSHEAAISQNVTRGRSCLASHAFDAAAPRTFHLPTVKQCVSPRTAAAVTPSAENWAHSASRVPGVPLSRRAKTPHPVSLLPSSATPAKARPAIDGITARAAHRTRGLFCRCQFSALESLCPPPLFLLTRHSPVSIRRGRARPPPGSRRPPGPRLPLPPIVRNLSLSRHPRVVLVLVVNSYADDDDTQNRLRPAPG